MDKKTLEDILRKVSSGAMSPDEAITKIKLEPYKDIDYAKIDTIRDIRQGMPEVIYGAGKSADQIIEIANTMLENGDETILITRIKDEDISKITSMPDVSYDEVSHTALVGKTRPVDVGGMILVVTGGTSDIPVAEEAVVTARAFGNNVECLYDVGVAGIHRLLDKTDRLLNANVIIAVAGMEGAIASVVGGIVDCPVIAVPTSVGYGSSFEGMAALLSMMNSCAPGVSVVNIDNGFGAGYLASRINHMKKEA